MTKQIKKLIAIFAVMAITMFAVIKANAEVKYVGMEGDLLKYQSSQLYGDIYMPIEDVYLADRIWDEVAAATGDIPGFKRTETTMQFDRVYKDAEDLLKLSDSFYILVNEPEYRESSRVWKSSVTSKYYQKRISWTKIGE